MLPARFFMEDVRNEDGVVVRQREVIEITLPNGTKSVHVPTVRDIETYDHAYAAFKNPKPAPPSHDDMLADWQEKNPDGVIPNPADVAAEADRLAAVARDRTNERATMAARTAAVPEVIGPPSAPGFAGAADVGQSGARGAIDPDVAVPLTPFGEARRQELLGRAVRTADEDAELAQLGGRPMTVPGAVGPMTIAEMDAERARDDALIEAGAVLPQPSETQSAAAAETKRVETTRLARRDVAEASIPGAASSPSVPGATKAD